MTLPEGWSLDQLTPHYFGAHKGGSGATGVAMIVIDHVYENPCDTTRGLRWVASLVDAQVSALSSMSWLHHRWREQWRDRRCARQDVHYQQLD